jgi:hypothetical protein
MSQFRESLRQTPEYQAQIEAKQPQNPQEADTVGDALAPVMSLEKGDLQFWSNVLTVVLLFLIYRELLRQGGR